MNQVLKLEITDLTADDYLSLYPYDTSEGAIQSLINFLTGLSGGVYRANIESLVGAEPATATITVATGGSGNNETMTICNVTFTAKTSGATGNQFNISATAATQAANMAAAINASADLAGIVTAEADAGVVTLTAVTPGAIGNGLQIANVDLANVTVSSFATEDTGDDGDEFDIDLR